MTVAIQNADPKTPGALAFLKDGEKRMLIGGSWVGGGGGSFATIDPATGATLARIARGDAADVDRAVAASHGAFESGAWTTMTPMSRARILWGSLIPWKPKSTNSSSWRPWIRASRCSSDVGRRPRKPSTSSGAIRFEGMDQLPRHVRRCFAHRGVKQSVLGA